MQQQLGQLEEDLKKAREQLAAVEEEKYRAFDELGEMKRVAEEANMRLSEALHAQATDTLSSRVDELEKASIESAKKRDQAWQLELEAVQKQHKLDLQTLSTTSRELDRVSKELAMALKCKDSALKEAEEAKDFNECNSKRVLDLSKELISLKELLANSCEQLENREEKIETLTLELENARKIEEDLKEKEATLEELKEESSKRRESESQTLIYLSESNLRVQELEIELENVREAEAKALQLLTLQKRQLQETQVLLEKAKEDIATVEIELEKTKEEEAKTHNSLLVQTQQLDETSTALEKARHEVIFLQEKVENLKHAVTQDSRDLDSDHQCHDENTERYANSIIENAKSLKNELQRAKEQVGENSATSRTEGLDAEMRRIRTELKSSMEAEEKSKKAMDDLAVVLIEVTKEKNELKDKLSATKGKLENERNEVESLKQTLKTTEEKFQKLLHEAKKETDQANSLAERLKLEAEDSAFAWIGKELEFVNCIKRAEDENAATRKESIKLISSLRLAEDTGKLLREENNKLRDILKQALNEASMSKEAATIAREENSQLKESHLEKDDLLQTLSREIERLRINEAAALENIKELKKLLSATSTMDNNADNGDLGRVFRKQSSLIKEHKDVKKITEVLNLTLEELKMPSLQKEEVEDPEKEEMLKGSIFDADVIDSPIAFQVPQHTPPLPSNHHHHHHHRRTSSISAMTEDEDAANLEDLDHLDDAHLDTAENDRSTQRKKKALLRRFGELIRKTSFHRREPSIGQCQGV
ncbi:hypothetical protein Scep_003558 [Stephania cephalantha]|uniref:Uncharacterized protein n=1 Tax=Stephania cephalantha TaxID=152367 RepID=A0AAP0PWF7_9MAGN